MGLAILPDQRIVATGWIGYDYQENRTIGLVRYNPDGSLDTSFDSDGIVTTEIGPYEDDARGVAIQSDGKIVVTGSTEHGPSQNTKDFVVLRYNIDGSLDTSFGGTGIVTTAIGSGEDVARSVAFQTDGKIVVAGSTRNGTNTDIALARYYS